MGPVSKTSMLATAALIIFGTAAKVSIYSWA
jgi:hypothetical protein